MSMKTIHLRALVGALALVLAVTVATPALAQGGAKIAIVDTQRILAQSSTGQAAQAEMEELRDAKTAEGQALQQEIEALRTRLNEGRLTETRSTQGLTVEEIGLMMGGAHGMEVAHV